ncbi:alanine aminotransferase 2-like [Porites lutea]|uniref:alanine aminotransferase 2-like n=1 Tax=Porites lutea TaxID=51062 RepID=UPI003CC6A9EA
MAAEEIITDKSIGHVYQNYATSRPWTDLRAHEIRRELQQGVSKPFNEVIKHFGDLHVFGQSPVSFMRQFLACLLCPSLLEEPSYPQDIKEKARRILEATEQFSIGSYTDTSGLRIVHEHVARFITKRDGYTADPDSIILISGGASGIKIALDVLSTGCFCSDEDRAGLMTPIPCFFHYPTWIKRLNLYQIPYYLDEDNDWALDIRELERALNESRSRGNCEAILKIKCSTKSVIGLDT